MSRAVDRRDAADTTSRDETLSSRAALVRRPRAELAEGIVTHIERVADRRRARLAQWERYVAAMRGQPGGDDRGASRRDDCPDAVFVEDTVVMYDRNVAVITRPGAESRKPEIGDVEKVVEALGLSLNRIQAPGTLDGGDVLKVGDTVYVGRGGRTNAEGIRQLRADPRTARRHGRRACR